MDIYNTLVTVQLVAAGVVAGYLLSPVATAAKYGRHAVKGGNVFDLWMDRLPKVDSRYAWILAECPSVFVFAAVYLTGNNKLSGNNLLLFLMWEVHYLNRTFVYPWLTYSTSSMLEIVHRTITSIEHHLKVDLAELSFILPPVQYDPQEENKVGVKKRSQWNLIPLVLAMLFNSLNSFNNAYFIGNIAPTHPSSVQTIQFAIGQMIFLAGLYINWEADQQLRSLRKKEHLEKRKSKVLATGNGHYVVPHGGLYDYITSPNYFGELVEWFGYFVASGSPGAFAFFVFSSANLIPRARQHREWYVKHFGDDFPKDRKIIVPFLY